MLLPEPVGPVTPTMWALAAVGEELAQGVAGLGVGVLDPGEDAGERAAVAVEDALCGLGGHAPAAAAPRLGALLRTQSMMSWVEEPGPKMPLKPSFSSLGDVFVGDDAAAEEDDVVHAALLQLLDDAREQLEVRAGEDGEADDVGVLLERGLGDHLGGLADAGVDDLEAGVAQGTGDDLGAAVMTVEAGFGDDDLELAFLGHGGRSIQLSVVGCQSGRLNALSVEFSLVAGAGFEPATQGL